jgi:eukaryotic-like serine/threonine-protein kinase
MHAPAQSTLRSRPHEVRALHERHERHSGWPSRFVVERVLGKGAQGTVYLALDTRLDRRVALKALRLGDAQDNALNEARMMSGLQHPNIVTLYDAETSGDTAFLVFEFVDGETLGAKLAREGRLSISLALRLTQDVLRGVAHAHANGTLHCDLKPGNILLAKHEHADESARVMDFGIAERITFARVRTGEQVSGTPAYLAPELVAGEAATPASDTFAIGVMLYEMLCGAPPIVGTTPYETLHRMAQEAFAPAVSRNAEVDAKLNALVMRAISKSPAERFESADAFSRAIADYLSPPAESSADGDIDASDPQSATLAFLLQRMRYKSDFPVLSGAVAAINRVVVSDREPTSALTNIILKDVALTNKLLRVVNAASYSRFGGTINTISRAVALLGFDKVRHTALSLVLFEHLHNRAQAADTQQLVGSSFFSGMLATELAKHDGRSDSEEIGICAMFHDLGRLIATFYLHDEATEIKRLAKLRGVSEDDAAKEVIGVTYLALGQCVARYWKLPADIIESMAGCEANTLSKADCAREPARVFASLAHEVASLTLEPQADTPDAQKKRAAALARIMQTYSKPLGISAESMSRMVVHARERFSTEAASIGLRCNAGRVNDAAGRIAETLAGAPVGAEGVSLPIANGVTSAALSAVHKDDASVNANQNRSSNARAVMMAGIQDITETLAGEYNLSEALGIIVETIYRSGTFSRVMLFTREPSGKRVRCRIAFGKDAESLTADALAISLLPERTVFYGALSRGADVAIQDVTHEKVAPLIPDWVKTRLNAQALLLLPLMVRNQAVGLIYADCDGGIDDFAEDDLKLLRTLRSQAVMAIRQKS